MGKLRFIMAIVCLPMLLHGQLTTEADWKRQVYDREFTGGIIFHNRGYGINFRNLYFNDGFDKWGMEFDLAMIRHPKEIKFPSPYFYNSSRSFVYGKLNGLFTLRTGYGRDKVLIDKTDQGSISISWITFGGLSLGFLKPVYLDIFKETPQGDLLSTERYNPEVHDYTDIFGQAPFFTGIENSSIRAGIYFKTGFAFDYNWSDKKVTTLEIGAIVDYFPQWFGLYKDVDLPIMYNSKNYNTWLQFYVSANFGSKWN